MVTILRRYFLNKKKIKNDELKNNCNYCKPNNYFLKTIMS